jgi:hypothetical protein
LQRVDPRIALLDKSFQFPAWRVHPCHICTGTGLIAATSAPGLSSRSQRRHHTQPRMARTPIAVLTTRVRSSCDAPFHMRSAAVVHRPCFVPPTVPGPHLCSYLARRATATVRDRIRRECACHGAHRAKRTAAPRKAIRITAAQRTGKAREETSTAVIGTAKQGDGASRDSPDLELVGERARVVPRICTRLHANRAVRLSIGAKRPVPMQMWQG